MSRNSSGTYTLPSGNPVVSGTLIEATWANNTLSDLASAMTDSLSRSGQGGMTAALRAFDGTSTVPGIAWGSETTTGFYRAGAGDTRLMITGSQVMQFLSTGVAITGTLSASGNASVGGTLSVTGAMTLTANPTLSAGTANGVLYLNGSKVATSGSALTFDGTTLGVANGVTGGTALSLTGTYAGSGTVAFMNFQRVGGAVAGTLGYDDASTAIRFGTTTNHSTIFLQNNSEAMRLTSTGLGIGTSSPSYKLHVAGTAATDTTGLGLTGSTTGYQRILINNTSGGAQFGVAGASPSTMTSGATAYATVIGDYAGYPLQFITNNTVKATLDTSGNLGLGVAPYSYSSGKAFDIGSTGAVYNDSAKSTFYYNNVYNNAGYKYKTTGGIATAYLQDVSAGHVWLTAPSGTAGNAISFTQAMTLDASGNLGVGTTTLTEKLNLGGNLVFRQSSNITTSSGYLNIQPASTLILDTGDAIHFRTGSNERARIDSSGNLLVGATGTANGKIHVNGSISFTIPSAFAGAGGNASWSTGFASTAINCSVWASNSFVGAGIYTYSDKRLKENIQPIVSSGALDFVTRVRPVEFDWKIDGTHDTGFIAQELLAAGYGHLVSAVPDGAIEEETDEDGNVSPAGARFTVKYDSVVAILTAAIQELKAEIDALKAKA